jgi:hypothetical protein
MTRLDPFVHAFGALAPSRFPEIRDEAIAEHRDLSDRPQFASLRTVQHVLGEVESPEVLDEHPDAGAEYLNALYVAYRFWSEGCHVIPVPRARLDAAMRRPVPRDVAEIPRGACYLRLPERWLWAQIDLAVPHEPLDGCFVVSGGPAHEVLVLAVLGLREDRPGFSQVTVSAQPDDLPLAHEGARTPRFASTLDGGEAAGLLSITTAAELLHLVHLALHEATAAS